MQPKALLPLPSQPADVPWPDGDWPRGPLPASSAERVTALLDAAFANPQPETTVLTTDIVIVHRGVLVAERYARGNSAADTQKSWSMAKSMFHAVAGILVRNKRIDVSMRAHVLEWSGDERVQITLDQLLHMTSGLRFGEDYVAGDSDVNRMLHNPGVPDTGAFAASFPLEYPPDTVFNYSSGTTNILSRIVRDLFGGGEAYRRFLHRELFDRIGMNSASPRFDASGTWVASSYCYCTPEDFARFGLLYLRDGIWRDERVLPEGWVDYARTPAPIQPADEASGYGAHWWLEPDDLGTFFAAGYAGQYIFIVPALDLIVVRNGDTPVERRPHVRRLIRELIDAFR
jgi:CubicO group peptidase (beta-lactamase class C family)